MAVARSPLVNDSQTHSKHRKRRAGCGEAAGGAVAVMCCCPCTVIKLLVLALYKLPAKVCRGWKRKTNKTKEKMRRGNDEVLIRKKRREAEESGGGGEEAAVVETEMLEGRGFWSSGSRRDLDG